MIQIQADNHYQHRLKDWQKPLYSGEEMMGLFLAAVWPLITVSMVVSLFNGW